MNSRLGALKEDNPFGGDDDEATETTLTIPKQPADARESVFAQTNFMESFFADAESIKADIQHVREATKEVMVLQDKAANAIGAQGEGELSEELEAVISRANKRCAHAKQRLQAIKADTEKLEEDSKQASELRIRKNMHTTLTQKFVQVVRVYQQAQQTYKSKITEKVARQVKVVKPDATMEEIDTAMRSGDTGAIYRAAILKGGNDPIAEAYRNVADKYQDVLKLEKSMEELHQMFIDMAFLVESQGEMLDQIEFQVNSAAEFIEQGNTNLVHANKSRKAMRKKMCCLALILVIVMGAILIPVLTNVL